MRFSRPNRGLQGTFPASERGEYPIPTEVGDHVSFVHPYPGREWERLVYFQQTSANVVTPTVVLVSAALDEWIEIVYGDVSHNSATARALQLQYNTGTGFNIFLGRWVSMVAALTNGTPSGFEPMFGNGGCVSSAAANEVIRPPRPLVMGPGTSLSLVGDTAGVAYQVTGTVGFVRHGLADSPLAI